MIYGSFEKILLATIVLASSTISSEEFAREETRWSVIREFVDPFVISSKNERQRRSAGEAHSNPEENDDVKEDDDVEDKERDESLRFISIGRWTIESVMNERLTLSPRFEAHWIERLPRSPIAGPNRERENSYRHFSECQLRQGRVLGRPRSSVVLTICSKEFYVMISIEDLLFFVSPFGDGRHVLEQSVKSSGSKNSESMEDLNEINNSSGYDKIVGNKKIRNKRGACPSKAFYNLTGDTFDIPSDFGPVNVQNPSTKLDETQEQKMSTTDRTNLMDSEDKDSVEYFYDRTWEKNKLPKRKIIGKDDEPARWLELGIAIDHSVINFHGQRVQQYVLALFNIVSAIYKDPSLDSNLRLVIVRMIFYSEKSDGMVRQGNAKKSLENVNKWNRRLLSSPEENHDVAVWLTRLDIGGPSGYAPVSGACDPSRSCALNRDEGLTSAFIIAHELAHVLGLTHDGDESAGNICGEEASMGSIMAPMVAATFHRFHWSSCSRKEFHHYAKNFHCLMNKPSDGNSTQFGRETSRETFTMDEQCRMEFGEGYALCRSFQLPGACSHLWCGHTSISQVCKTKKGPPLEGTLCAKNKRCVNGYCEYIDKRVGDGLDRVRKKPRDGGWSAWSPWGKCSTSCGVGVRYRFRQCNQPIPVFGGKDCVGSSEDFATCQQSDCSTSTDPKQQQCLRLSTIVGFDESSPQFSMTWLPHEPDEESLRCQISCRSAESNEIFISKELTVPDGTRCSYDSSDICLQGTCRRMGCDRIFDSEAKIDSCGVCNGHDTACSKVVNKFSRKIRRGMTRIAMVARGGWNFSANLTIVARSSLAHENLTLTIRDRRRRRNDLKYFDDSGKSRNIVVEGAVFKSQRFGDAYQISTRGPLSSHVIISLAVPESSVKSGVRISVKSRYFLNSNEPRKKSKYSWIAGNWGPCSVSCGGGTRRRSVACKDEETGRLTKRKRCSLLTRPMKQHEKCNQFSCEYKWIVGSWEECSARCGNEGIQEREVFCVHSNFPDNNESTRSENELRGGYRIVESAKRCNDDHRPETRRECNRISCNSTHWLFHDWSAIGEINLPVKPIPET